MPNHQQTFQVMPNNFVYGGECLGRLTDGRAVFVPFVLPGEKVQIRLIEEKSRYAKAELLQVLEQSPSRLTPRCIHFGFCGGCHYQHIPYEDQLVAKRSILTDQLERLGNIANPTVDPTLASPIKYHYRNHVQFHLTPEGQLGYYRANTKQTFPISECHLPEENLNSLWPLLDIEPIPGLYAIHLRNGIEDEALVILESRSPDLPEFSVEDLSVSVVQTSPAGSQVLAGNPYISVQVLERVFRVSPESFFQVNTPMAAEMVSHVIKGLAKNTYTCILELYAGVGLFSAFIAPMVEKLICVESSQTACDDFAYNLDEFSNVDLYQGEVEEILPNLDSKPQVIIMDPPRRGVGKKIIDSILDYHPDQIIYISCDPATLARDAHRLVLGGYEPIQITPFDLFPQTYHIESISSWNKI
jgi:23S rRNA (uracil1939-C5)-methyltransferase